VRLNQQRLGFQPIGKTYLEYSIQLTGRILKFLVFLCLGAEIILEGIDCTRVVSGGLIRLDGEYSQVFACHVQARHRPGFKPAVGVTANELIRQLFPCFVNFVPGCL